LLIDQPQLRDRILKRVGTDNPDGVTSELQSEGESSQLATRLSKRSEPCCFTSLL
jgi:hypothetical protein